MALIEQIEGVFCPNGVEAKLGLFIVYKLRLFLDCEFDQDCPTTSMECTLINGDGYCCTLKAKKREVVIILGLKQEISAEMCPNGEEAIQSRSKICYFIASFRLGCTNQSECRVNGEYCLSVHGQGFCCKR